MYVWHWVEEDGISMYYIYNMPSCLNDVTHWLIPGTWQEDN